MNLAVASAASATGTEVNEISLEENQSTMLPSVVVPIPTQIFAPLSALAELPESADRKHLHGLKYLVHRRSSYLRNQRLDQHHDL